ncbi:hypothetical protein ACFVJK_49225 [Streptomyces sp. NPDC127172]|uniref:hypothetical protein n=1 Tax=Streptomyces sp. NPDC127172 TaxID=3345382 RepID=UPI0036353283
MRRARGRSRPLYARREPRAHALDYLRGLLADLPRKNCWTMTGHAGKTRACGLQRLSGQAVWGEDAALDVVRHFAVRHLHCRAHLGRKHVATIVRVLG